MKIVQIYSHLNGLEYLMVHKPKLLDEIKSVVSEIDADSARVKISKERNKVGKILYSPSVLNAAFKKAFSYYGWDEMRISYFVNEDTMTTRETVDIRDKISQKEKILASGYIPLSTYNQVDFVKDRVAVEVQFGKYFSVQYDLHVKHTFFYGRGDIDVGIEVIPMHSLMTMMSSGVAWYENELTNIIREGRSNPSVPIVLIGIEPD